MPRLVNWPGGVVPATLTPLTGPANAKGGADSMTGFQQTVSGPMGVWSWQVTFAPMAGPTYRDFRGFFTDLEIGQNATRWSPIDKHKIRVEQYAIVQGQYGVPWSNGLPWSNGQNWQTGHATIPAGAAAAKGDNEVVISIAQWGALLGRGDYIGFLPDHYGIYMVLRKLTQDRYQIWPPLRKAVLSTDKVTLYPSLIVRPFPGTLKHHSVNPNNAAGAEVTFVEVKDEDVRAFYT